MIVLRQAMQATVFLPHTLSPSPRWDPVRRRHLCERAIAQAFRHTVASQLLPWRDKCVAISATDDKRQTTNVSLGCACAKYLSTGAHSTRRHVASVRCSWRRTHPGTSLGAVGKLEQLHTQIAACNALGRQNARGAYRTARGAVCKRGSWRVLNERGRIAVGLLVNETTAWESNKS